MWNTVVTIFREYMGTGLIVGWFLLSVVYLLIKEKRKNIRIMFVYVPVILLLLFFNPLFAKLIYTFVQDDEIYYRILWLIPITAVIAYAAVHMYSVLKGRVRIVFAGVCVVLVMLSGSFIYNNVFFNKAENLYHVPQSVVDICDAIEVEGREVMAVFPAELLQYVRQYSPVVCMPYGRETIVDRWGMNHELYDVMEASVVDVKELVRLARDTENNGLNACHYIILRQDKERLGDLEDYDYRLFKSVDGYDVYLDTTQYLGTEYF